MADKDDHASLNDDELLENAIPIDEIGEEDGTAPTSSGLPEVELAEEGPAASQTSTKIRAFGSTKRHEDHWNRTPNVTGEGAIHVRTFVAKLRLDAIDHLDEQVNEWLDAHPQYEVKFVTTAIGELTGKTKEQAVFMNVWV